MRQGREDISQDVFPPPEAFRLGGEHGFGGWGLDIGEAEGFGAVGSGVGAKFSWTEVNGDGIGNGIGNGIGGGIGGGGAGEGAVLEAWPVDAGLDADVFLGAEDGFVSRALGRCTPGGVGWGEMPRACPVAFAAYHA